MIQLKYKAKPGFAPTRATDGSAGLDLRAALEKQCLCHILPNETVVIPTGLWVEIPKGYVGLICPRSGLAKYDALTVLNAPGILDADFRGEVQVLLHNTSSLRRIIAHYDRIAQLVIVPCPAVQLVEVPELSETVRGSGGFGSSGK